MKGFEGSCVIHRSPEKRDKGKAHFRTGYEVPEGEYTYNCTLSLTSVLDRGG